MAKITHLQIPGGLVGTVGLYSAFRYPLSAERQVLIAKKMEQSDFFTFLTTEVHDSVAANAQNKDKTCKLLG